MRLLLITILTICLVGCDQLSGNSQQEKFEAPSSDHLLAVEQHKNKSHVLQKQRYKEYKTVEWTELIPKSDLAALLDPPDYIVQVEDGSIEDQIAYSMKNVMNANSVRDNPYEKALTSTNVITDMHHIDIRIPGFVVPVLFNDKQIVKSFFLVPYFGACLHMPPPPPNQIIYVEVEDGFELTSLYDPIWVSGKLSVEMFEDQIATSAYTMKMDKMEKYKESD